MVGKRRRGEGRRRFWLLAVVIAAVVLASGGLIAYNMLSRGSCSYLEAWGVEVYLDRSSSLLPNYSLATVGPKTARYEVYVFYDLYCPYCAWELYESLGILVGYAEEGKVKLYFVDTVLHTVLHREALESHGLLRSLVGSNGLYLEALYRAACELHVKRNNPDPAFMRKVFRELNVTVDERRAEREAVEARRVTEAAVSLLAGILGSQRYVGTPTIVIYDVEQRRIVDVIPGRVEAREIELRLRQLP